MHWIVPILAGIPFGAGVAQIMQSLVQYLMDAYTLYCASAIASSVVLRSITATAFPLFTPKLYAALGDQWACSIFAFLALACMPIPYLLMVSSIWRQRECFSLRTWRRDGGRGCAAGRTTRTARSGRGHNSNRLPAAQMSRSSHDQ